MMALYGLYSFGKYIQKNAVCKVFGLHSKPVAKRDAKISFFFWQLGLQLYEIDSYKCYQYCFVDVFFHSLCCLMFV